MSTAVDSSSILGHISKVTPALVDLYITILKQLHKKGKPHIKQYLVRPLRAMFERPLKKKQLNIVVKHLENHLKNGELSKVVHNYKDLLQQTVFDTNEQKLIKVFSRLMLDLEKVDRLRESGFATNLFRQLQDSFNEFHQQNLVELQNNFDQALESADTESFGGSSLNKSSEISPALQEKLNKEAEELYLKIERAYVMQKESELSYLLAQFTGRFCNFSEVARRKDVDKIIDDLMQKNPAVRRDVIERLSIRIYREIFNAVEKGNIRLAVRGIATYTLTFQNEQHVPYRKELDILEEKLYGYIAKHNLWQRVKVQ